jgi:hypothetical protein
VDYLDVVMLVCGCQNFALIDKVHVQRLEHLRLNKVADASFGHDGDGHGFLDFLDDARIRHARNTPCRCCTRA